MGTTTHASQRVLGGVVSLLLWWAIAGTLFAGEGELTPTETSAPRAPFALSIDAGLLSLTAEDASLKAILDEIGRRMHIDVEVRLHGQEKISLTFDRLSVVEALKRFGKYIDYAYVDDPKTGGIAKIMVTPKRTGVSASDSPTQEPEMAAAPERRVGEETGQDEPRRPAPFKFEFNPADFMGKSQ